MSRPRYILGISAFYHDSAAALIDGGEIVAAAQEERFTRKRHDAAFPASAIDYCLSAAGVTPEQLDYVCFYDKPFKKFDRLLETYLAYAPVGFASFRQALPVWLKQKLYVRRELRRGLKRRYKGPLVFLEHHESHAASAFYPSPFERAAILTSDGVGEWATTTWGLGEGRRIEIKQSISFPHSLGLLYSAFTHFAGFKVNSGEYKLMGLAPYGEPVYARLIEEKLIDLKPDGSYRLNMDYFSYPNTLRMTGAKFAALFGGPPRRPESPLTQRELDLAASVQAVTEEVILRTARHIHERTKMRQLCLAGGVALNCVANGRLLREAPFDDVWVQPAAGDAGGALGAALFVWHQLLENERVAGPGDKQNGSFLGPSFETRDICALLEAKGAKFTVFTDEDRLLDRAAAEIAAGAVLGWFHGRSEFGPRALGARSLLADPRNAEMQSTMNLKIKFRESFRPFAPCVLQERAHEIFELRQGHESPYMLFTAPVRPQHRCALNNEQRRAMADPNLLRRINVVRSIYPAITHVDYSARIQTVDERRHGRFFRLMKTFERKTGCPVLVNTSFNIRGEPIVNSPLDALNCFLHTAMDVLVLEDCVLRKAEQPQALLPHEPQRYLQQYGLD